jgi:hypothetical protein
MVVDSDIYTSAAGTITSGGIPVRPGVTSAIPSWTATPSTITSGNWLNNVSLNNIQPQGGTLKVAGDAVFDGEVTIRGVKLDERLNAIEERLGILRPNNGLEGKWEELKALGDEYRALEKDILQKEKIWSLLKK